MKTEDVLLFWSSKVDLADYLGINAGMISRFVRYGEIPTEYHAKIKKGIKARMKLLTSKAEGLLE